MSATGHGPLVFTVTSLLASLALLAFAAPAPAPADAMSLGSASGASKGSSLLDIPASIDEDDLLEEYGRFMLGAMNRSVGPCEDFYEFACGNWRHHEMLPPRARNDSFLHAMQTRLDDLLEDFLANRTTAAPLTSTTSSESSSTSSSSSSSSTSPPVARRTQSSSAEEKAKTFYAACLQTRGELERGYRQLLALDEFRAAPPADWIAANFLSRHGVFPLLPLAVQYETESRKFELQLSPPQPVLAKAAWLDPKNLTRDFKLDGPAQDSLRHMIAEMLAFERNLTAQAQRRNETEVLSLGAFLAAHQADRLNWTRFFEAAFNGTARKEWVVRSQLGDVAGLELLLRRTPTPLLRDYVQWRTLARFYAIWRQEAADRRPESACRRHTEQYFGHALLPWFIDVAYDADRRADVLRVARAVRDSFGERLERHAWLDAETRSAARTKLRSMDVLAGYTDDMRRRDVADALYANVSVQRGDWFGALYALEEQRARARMRSVDRALIPPLLSTRDVNAYYMDFLNLAFVAVGIAQLPFYHRRLPPALKFGGVGVIAGHEMAHAFDTNCYRLDYDGRRRNWWTEASLRGFRERYRCLESQYNKFVYHGLATNGTLTAADNLADNVGTRLAYDAYQREAGRRDGDRRPLPGVEFTNRQLFFLKFAQSWCSGRDEASKLRHMRTDVHAHEQFRVIGTLSNMPEFSEAFQCQLGSEMNPLKKCEVW